jgi:hypothetical protein
MGVVMVARFENPRGGVWRGVGVGKEKMQLTGQWKTTNGLIATVREKVPKLRQYFGTVKEKGKEHETIWYDCGINAEFAEWDLDKRMEETNASSSQSRNA